MVQFVYSVCLSVLKNAAIDSILDSPLKFMLSYYKQAFLVFCLFTVLLI